MTQEEIAALAAQVHARVLAWPVGAGGRWYDRAAQPAYDVTRPVPFAAQAEAREHG